MEGMYIEEINRLKGENEDLKKENESLQKEVVYFMKQAGKAELRIKELEESCENFAEVERNLLNKLNALPGNRENTK